MSNTQKSQVSLRLPTDLVEKFDKIADYLERDRTWVILQALKQYFEDGEEGFDLLDEAEGYAQAERGELVPLEDVIEEAVKRISAAERKRAS
jgi:predicted transcriptional regulator